MVSHSHLSNGNSDSVSSHDSFADYGVSRPNPSSILSIEDMGESDAVPQPSPLRPVDSISLDNVLAVDVGPALSSEAQDIFKAAHYFTKQDRAEALEERKKNLQLQRFLSAHGFTVEDVHSFISEGKQKQKMDNALQVFDNNPSGNIGSSGVNSGSPLSLSPLRHHLVPVTCVGEDSLPGRVPRSLAPVVSPVGVKPAVVRETQSSNPNLNSSSHISDAAKCPHQMPGLAKSWSNIVSSKSEQARASLSYFPPSPSEGNILIKPPIEVLQRGNQIWSSSLVGYFLHSKLPFKVVEPIARRLWGNMGLLKVILHSKGYYIFKFQSTEDRDGVLASGPWHFASKGIVLQPWQEGVEFAKADYDKFPIWVKLSNIPLSYWSAEGISYIASGIGKPLCTDELTSKFELLNFARVCIEVNASFSFPSSLNVTVLNSETLEDTIVPIEVEYQSKPPSCPTCKVFGHSPLKCPKTNYQWIPKVKKLQRSQSSQTLTPHPRQVSLFPQLLKIVFKTCPESVIPTHLIKMMVLQMTG